MKRTARKLHTVSEKPLLTLRFFGREASFQKSRTQIHWAKTNSDYWIQWTVKDDAAVLWAYDPEAKKAVEVLQVRER